MPRPAHTFSENSERGVYDNASCEISGHNYTVCDVCHGKVLEPVPALGHDWKITVCEGNCMEARITYTECLRCHIRTEEWDYETDKDKHKWVTGTGREWSDEKLEMVEYTMVVCDICNEPLDGVKTYK